MTEPTGPVRGDSIEEYMGGHDCRKCPPLQLSEHGQETLEAMAAWKTIGPGRLRRLRELAAELLALQKERRVNGDPDAAVR